MLRAEDAESADNRWFLLFGAQLTMSDTAAGAESRGASPEAAIAADSAGPGVTADGEPSADVLASEATPQGADCADDDFGEFEGGGSWSDDEDDIGDDEEQDSEAAGYAMLPDDGGSPTLGALSGEAAAAAAPEDDGVAMRSDAAPGEDDATLDAASVRAVIAVSRAARQAAVLDADYEETVRSAAAAAVAASGDTRAREAVPATPGSGAESGAGASSAAVSADLSGDLALPGEMAAASGEDFDPFGTERRIAARKEAIRRRRVVNDYTSAASTEPSPARAAMAAATVPQTGLAEQRIGRFSPSQRRKIQASMKKLALSPPGVFVEGATNAALDRIVAAAIAKGRKMLDVEAAMLPPEA